MARTSCLVLLLLLSTAFLAFGDDVIIDCGSSDVYVDNNLVVWTGDESFMGNIGESKVVQTRSGLSQTMTTLRVFTSGTKNCYTIKSTEGQRVLARASFYYGNYDKKSAPPTFDLLFDGNYWGSIETLLDQVVDTEVSYVVKSAVTNICLAQSKANQFPFISALEVRELDTKMYSLLDSSYALITNERVAFGATSPIRFSDDVYDRIWNPAGAASTGLVIKNDALPLSIDVSTAPDKPPQAIFTTAITAPNTSYSMSITPTFPAGEFPVYVNLYVIEVTQLTTTQTREINVYMDDKLLYSVVPFYQRVLEMSFNATASSKSSIVLRPSLSSTLPPLISAAEVFFVTGPLNESTHSNDVDGLQALKTGFTGSLDQWSGDPCLPSPYSWEWITCTSDPIPRDTELNLGSFGLSGLLPDFSSMDSLEIVDLRENKITGPIPDFLGAFPNLKVLNLANNSFSGPIPDSISKNAKLKLQISGNPQLCDTGKSCPTHTDTPVVGSPGNGGSGRKKKSKTPIIIGIAIAIAALFACGIVVTLCFKLKRAATTGGGTTDGASEPHDTVQVQAKQKIGEALVDEITVSIGDEHEVVHQKNTANNQQAAVY